MENQHKQAERMQKAHGLVAQMKKAIRLSELLLPVTDEWDRFYASQYS